MEFKISWKRRFFWHSRKVIGASYIEKYDKMNLTFPDNTAMEIPEWSKCHVKVGKDWFDAVKKNMEEHAGQTIPFKR